MPRLFSSLTLLLVLAGSSPAAEPTKATTWDEMLRDRRSWWSLQPVHKPELSAVHDEKWCADPIDRFILAKLEAKNLHPAEAADPRTLIRRLSLVLTGLPPTREETERFLRERSAKPEEAYAALVDRLIASPHFGERWARHWMDVVRYTETHGNEWNYEVHHAWRYRDYLIRAFNDDLPYDRFVKEHIAGDLLPPRRNKEGFNESPIGTAFWRFGEVNHDDCISLPAIGYDIADNQIDTLGKAFQATTIACARCHDHKLDAVSMKDYYALLGIVRSSRLVSHTLDGPEANVARLKQLRELKGEIRKELATIWARDTVDFSRYLAGGSGLDPERKKRWTAALADKTTPDHIFGPWRASAEWSDFNVGWKQLAEQFSKDDKERTDFNKRFEMLADFTTGTDGWQVGGLGLRDGPTRAGEFTIHHAGDALVRSVLPAGTFTHSLSEKLNGTLRSPVLTTNKKHISFLVMGKSSSAVRLVSNNCQLNYTNYRALTSEDLQWLTFKLPEEGNRLRVYAELMTMLDNPKFPDQLSALGGDKVNYRLPWEKAVSDGRSFFAIRKVLLHNDPAPPKPDPSHLKPLFAGRVPTNRNDLANRYSEIIAAAVKAWAEDRATDDDARWLDYLVHRGLLGNSPALSQRLEALAKQYRQIEAELALPRVSPGIADCGPGFEQPIFTRGDCTRPGDVVPRRYLEVLSKPGDTFKNGSGRFELAERLADPKNPLTARVMVNRVWHHLFGAGIVRTVDDFGRVGELPSHPELLDHLATRFVQEGWSVKRLIRALVLTRTFRLSNVPSAWAKEIDPNDRLLQHYPARRLEGEVIRDSILAASGRLDRTMYGMSIPSYREKESADRRLFPGPLDGNGRRSVYIRSTLMEAPRFLEVFDFPGCKVAQGRRDVTNVPAQALALLNDPFVAQQAEVWARKLVARKVVTAASRVAYMFEVALSRPPSKDESKRYEEAIARLAELHQVKSDLVLSSEVIWKDVAHTMFNMKEFIYIP
jgi:hypothetical protein